MMIDAERAYSQAKARTSPYNKEDLAGLSDLRVFLDQHKPGKPAQ
jgi:hypothetical protein